MTRSGFTGRILGLALIAVTGSGAAGAGTIAILGSSNAAGVGATTYDSSFAGRYGHYLAGLSPAWQLKNLAVSGYTTYHVMPTGYKPPAGRPLPDSAHNITKVLALKPQVLLICLTGNDIANGYAASEFNANFDSLAAWGTKAGIQVWITTPLPRTANDSAKRAMVMALRERILSRYAPRAVDIYQGLGGPDGRYYQAYDFGDGIHVNNPGHKLVFQRLVAADITGSIATGVAFSTPASGGNVSSRLPILAFDPRRGALLVRAIGRAVTDIRGRRPAL
jgi:lysophospholipase L1-like esterase